MLAAAIFRSTLDVERSTLEVHLFSPASPPFLNYELRELHETPPASPPIRTPIELRGGAIRLS